MTGTPVSGALNREARKRDLLLASKLARGQAIDAFAQIAQRADSAASVAVRARAALANPAVWAAGSAAVALLGVTLRRTRPLALLRWGFLAWRTWRVVAPALAHPRDGLGSFRRGRSPTSGS